jgi:hypothetical protein
MSYDEERGDEKEFEVFNDEDKEEEQKNLEEQMCRVIAKLLEEGLI